MTPRLPILLALSLVLSACADEVLVRGTVTRGLGDKTSPLSSGTVTILDDGGTVYDSDETDGQGRFRVRAPAGAVIFATVEGADQVPTAFTGVSGIDSDLVLDDGTLYSVPESLRRDWVETFKGCTGVDDGALVVGQMREFILGGDDPESHPIISNGKVVARLPDGEEVEACYLDADGERYDPDADRTGPSGWYAIPDLPSGPLTLTAQLHINDQGDHTSAFYDVWLPEDGVAPRFPTWVQMPL